MLHAVKTLFHKLYSYRVGRVITKSTGMDMHNSLIITGNSKIAQGKIHVRPIKRACFTNEKITYIGNEYELSLTDITKYLNSGVADKECVMHGWKTIGEIKGKISISRINEL